jgi:DnaJ-class molecular chaperone
MEVKIPAGVETGSRLRVQGEGEAGTQGGPQAICMWLSTLQNTSSLSDKVATFTRLCP